MLFIFRSVADATVRTLLRTQNERRLRFATDRFQPHIVEVGVVLLDENGPRAGVDKVCRVTARLRRGGALEIQETRSSFLGAIRAAARRLRSALARRVGGKTRRSGLRRGRWPYRRPWSLR